MNRMQSLCLRYMGIASVALWVTACKVPEDPQVPDPNAAESILPGITVLQNATELDTAQAAQPSQPFSLCNLESLDNHPFGAEPYYVPATPGSVELGGWMGASAAGELSRSPMVILKQEGGARTWTIPITYNTPRPDVAADRGIPALRRGGFRVLMDLSTLPPGVYHVLLGDGIQFNCDNGRRLKF